MTNSTSGTYGTIGSCTGHVQSPCKSISYMCTHPESACTHYRKFESLLLDFYNNAQSLTVTVVASITVFSCY